VFEVVPVAPDEGSVHGGRSAAAAAGHRGLGAENAGGASAPALQPEEVQNLVHEALFQQYHVHQKRQRC
jgi:hypothetical protein